MKERKLTKRDFFIAIMIALQVFLLGDALYACSRFPSANASVYYAADRFASRAVLTDEDGYLSVSEDLDNEALSSISDYNNIFTYGPWIDLGKGIYDVTVFYSATEDGTECYTNSNNLTQLMYLKAPYRVALPKEQTDVTFRIFLKSDCPDFELITTYPGQGTFSFKGMAVTLSFDTCLRKLVMRVFVCMLLSFAAAICLMRYDSRKKWLLLGIIGLISCYPLASDFLYYGHDIMFHLNRIEGLYNGLQNGIFPVKIHPFWLDDYGYSVGVFYGDTFLYFPAFLRLMGLTVQEAYKAYVVALNLATVLISYFSFKRIFRSENIGIFAAFLYTLAPYRMMNLYLRGALGEYTALTFLPLVLCGFFLIFTENPTQKGYWQNFLFPAIGLTGIIQSHVISSELVAVFILITCLLRIRKVLVPETFLTLLFAAFTTVLLNLNFLIPFLSYFGGDFVMNGEEWFQAPIQSQGVYPTQLFAFFQNAVGSSKIAVFGIQGEMGLGIGFSFVLGILCLLFLLADDLGKREKNTHFSFAIVCLILSACSLFMSTVLFPWDAIADFSNITRTLIYNIQFPWRLHTISTVLLTAISCYAMLMLKKYYSKELFYSALGILLCVQMVTIGWLFYGLAENSSYMTAYSGRDLRSQEIGSSEYLPYGTRTELFTPGHITLSETVSCSDYQKRGTDAWLQLASTTEGYVELPLLYYEGYAAIGEKNTSLTVEKGDNNVVRVRVPAGYTGNVHVFFKEPELWRIGEAITLITVAALILYGIICSILRHIQQKKEHLLYAENPPTI